MGHTYGVSRSLHPLSHAACWNVRGEPGLPPALSANPPRHITRTNAIKYERHHDHHGTSYGRVTSKCEKRSCFLKSAGVDDILRCLRLISVGTIKLSTVLMNLVYQLLGPGQGFLFGTGLPLWRLQCLPVACLVHHPVYTKTTHKGTRMWRFTSHVCHKVIE